MLRTSVPITVLDLRSSNTNIHSHLLQFVWLTKTKWWCTKQHEFQWSTLPKNEANYSRQAVFCKTQLINENLKSAMKVSYSPINILRFFFILFVSNVSSVESDLRRVYIQFLKNSVFGCGLEMPGFFTSAICC